jgi:hypothetical protein
MESIIEQNGSCDERTIDMYACLIYINIKFLYLQARKKTQDRIR